MLITLHGIANCVKNETIRKMFLQTMTASCHDVAFNFFRAVLRILLTAFLERKTELWKLMSAFLGCCIGSIGSPRSSVPAQDKSQLMD